MNQLLINFNLRFTRLYNISCTYQYIEYSLNERLTEITPQTRHDLRRELCDYYSVSRVIWRRVREELQSVQRYTRTDSSPERLEVGRSFPVSSCDISHNKKIGGNRAKTFSAQRIFRVPSAARCWFQTRRRLVQDTSTTRSKAPRVLATRLIVRVLECVVGRRVLCLGEDPCAPFRWDGRTDARVLWRGVRLDASVRARFRYPFSWIVLSQYWYSSIARWYAPVRSETRPIRVVASRSLALAILWLNLTKGIL